jgi:hypothetical protein
MGTSKAIGILCSVLSLEFPTVFFKIGIKEKAMINIGLKRFATLAEADPCDYKKKF